MAQDGNLALGALPEAFEDLHRGGLAGAVRAEEREDLPAPHIQIDASDRLVAAIALHQAADADHRLRMGRGGAFLACAAFLADAVHLAPQAWWVLPASLLRDGCAVFGAAVEPARRQYLNPGWRGLHPGVEARWPRIRPSGTRRRRDPAVRLSGEQPSRHFGRHARAGTGAGPRTGGLPFDPRARGCRDRVRGDHLVPGPASSG